MDLASPAVSGTSVYANGLIGETRNETNVHDVPTPIVSSNKEIQSSISNEDYGKRFWAPSRSSISAS